MGIGPRPAVWGVALLLLPLCAHAQLDPSSPWPKWAHDNRNSGIGPDGTVYVGTKDYSGGASNQSGTLWAIREEQNGQPYDYWHVAATATHYLGPVEGSPVVDPAGYVYVGTRYFTEPPWNETHGFVYAVWGFDQ